MVRAQRGAHVRVVRERYALCRYTTAQLPAACGGALSENSGVLVCLRFALVASARERLVIVCRSLIW